MSAIKVINLYTSVYLNKDLCEPAVEPVVQFHLSSNSLVLKEKEKKTKQLSLSCSMNKATA